MSDNKLKISVITVCYNAAKTIEPTIRSVLDQTYPNIEYIIIDGQSKDETLSIVEKYKDRIAKIISEKDRGIYDAMNKGVRIAGGGILYFLNSDDRLVDSRVLTDIAAAFQKDPNWGMVYGKVIFDNIPAEMKYNYKDYPFEKKNRFDLLLRVNPQQCVFASKWVFDKIGAFDAKMKICADYDWFLRVCNRKIPYKFIDRDIAFCNVQGRSYTQRYEVLLEKIGVVYKNSNPFEFAVYFLYATFKKLTDIILEFINKLKK